MSFLVLALIVPAMIAIPSQNVYAATGTNGQQFVLTICYANSFSIKGNNQKGALVTYNSTANPYGCGTYKTTNWWWIGPITITADFPSGGRTLNGPYIPKVNPAPGNDGISYSFPQLYYDEILGRAKKWVDSGVPYNQNANRDGYRTDCSGFVSYAWKLPTSAVTGTLNKYANQVNFDSLQPGDAINNQQAGNSGHVVLFVKWINKGSGTFVAYEENGGAGKAIQKNLTLVKSSNTVGYINEYNWLTKSWIGQRKK